MTTAAAAAVASKKGGTAKTPKQVKVAAAKARKDARRAFRKQVEVDTAAKIATLSEGGDIGAVDVSASFSNAHRPLPAPPPTGSSLTGTPTCTICLFYQYKEPAWTVKNHKSVLNRVTELATKHKVTGRGRCAPEGLNCTLTASANDIRAFCYALREWDPLFNETDFKLEDGVPNKNRFRTFTLRKTNELVGYGLGGSKAPSINRHSGLHLDATDYHKQMEKQDTVIIDVRNKYESDIGHFQPPKGGATLLDPQMRNSQDFPKWLSSEETKAKLKNKTVMMYCTGGIRCERATALLNQITDAADDDFKTKDVVMVRGGIERYLKTFKEGGYWKGKNYLFDKRMEQAPSEKTKEGLKNDIESVCCICRIPCAEYRGQHKCAKIIPSGLTCAVPVIVCNDCQQGATDEPHKLTCPLCRKGYYTPEIAPDLLGQKRKLGLIVKGGDLVTGQKVTNIQQDEDDTSENVSQRIFVGKLPLTITATKLRNAFGDSKIEMIQWIVDRHTKAFYGSAFCQMKSVEDSVNAVQGLCVLSSPGKKKAHNNRRRKSKKARIVFAPLREEESWPPESYSETEYPPLG